MTITILIVVPALLIIIIIMFIIIIIIVITLLLLFNAHNSCQWNRCQNKLIMLRKMYNWFSIDIE
jgi:uncharacterized protein YpmB